MTVGCDIVMVDMTNPIVVDVGMVEIENEIQMRSWRCVAGLEVAG